MTNCCAKIEMLTPTTTPWSPKHQTFIPAEHRRETTREFLCQDARRFWTSCDPLGSISTNSRNSRARASTKCSFIAKSCAQRERERGTPDQVSVDLGASYRLLHSASFHIKVRSLRTSTVVDIHSTRQAPAQSQSQSRLFRSHNTHCKQHNKVKMTSEDYEKERTIVDGSIYVPGSDGTSAHSSFDEPKVDEVRAVRDVAKRDTKSVQCWRWIVTAALFATAVAVSYTTYVLLDKEETLIMEATYRSITQALEDNALDHIGHIQLAFKGLADSMSIHARSTNQTWPFVTIPSFQTDVANFLELSRMELVGAFHRVEPGEEAMRWEGYAGEQYEAMVQEWHLERYGNLNRLNPVGFSPDIGSVNASATINSNASRFVSWEYGPPPFTYWLINKDLRVGSDGLITALLRLRNQTVMSDASDITESMKDVMTDEEHAAYHSELRGSQPDHPHAFLYHPIHQHTSDSTSNIVGVLSGAVSLDAPLRNLLPTEIDGIIAVIKNTCGQSFTYLIDGKEALYQGEGDRHDSKYDKYKLTIDLSFSNHPDFAATPNHCRYTMYVYPSNRFVDRFLSPLPRIFAGAVSAVVFMVAIIFYIYDMFVHRRNEKLVANAAQSNALVSTLIPANIRDRIIQHDQNEDGDVEKRIANMKNFLAGRVGDDDLNKQPIADLFLETSIMFADIAGFTAWSSVREPSQVFTFLEAIFSSFDQVAKARRVFKVETVADCYVAATGIPEYKKDHAVVMVRFARDILRRMDTMTKDLEISHGPDTAELSLRIGIHSGPVTAGVLRGERARFQLFGDTMNTASRMESTGQIGRIHASSETADCLTVCNKGHWVTKRDGLVHAKGKGDMQTFWIKHEQDHGSDGQSVATDTVGTTGSLSDSAGLRTTGKTATDLMSGGINERTMRLVNWNVEMMTTLIQRILVYRRHGTNGQTKKPLTSQWVAQFQHQQQLEQQKQSGIDFMKFPLDEVQEIIYLPPFNPDVERATAEELGEEAAEAPAAVIEQLRSFISAIAGMYNESNSFHNFEHASHVTMSVIKLLSRIVAPTSDELKMRKDAASTASETDTESDGDTRSSRVSSSEAPATQSAAATLHDHTHGITSDPLTQFACAFSALIHDVDHAGVPNAQLAKENTRISKIYHNRSVAEQNSLVLAWDMFMLEEYADLRSCICGSFDELDRFRKLVINSVMATDIADKDLKQLRNGRWDKAFAASAGDGSICRQEPELVADATNRKATIVIEHLIQASDVAHTMQHWHVYRKWNERYFKECYAAYKDGRAPSDPIETWYKGEIGFFDFYIIPLAKKLKECGVFGKSSDEYLNYALANRKEWKLKGEAIVQEMAESVLGTAGAAAASRDE